MFYFNLDVKDIDILKQKKKCDTNVPNRFRRTFYGQHHAFADVRAHSIAGLTQVIPPILLQHVTNQQRTVGQDLNATRKGDRVILLGVPNTWRTKMERILCHQNHRHLSLTKLQFHSFGDSDFRQNLWHASRRLWVADILPPNNWEPLTFRRSRPGYWVGPGNEEELGQTRARFMMTCRQMWDFERPWCSPGVTQELTLRYLAIWYCR